MKKRESLKAERGSIFTGHWPVQSHYEIAKNVVRPRVSETDDKLPRLIDPGAFPKIAWEFGGIENEIQLLTFTHKFGLLGYNRLVPAARRCGGDPVAWSLGHARRVCVAFEIIQLIKRGPQSVRKELPSLLRSIRFDLMGADADPESLKKRLFKPDSLWDSAWPGDSLRVAWRVLSKLINDQIHGLRVEVSDDKLRPVFAFDALLQVIYWQLASELNDLNLHLCIVCGIFFLAKRVDANHCSARCRVRESRKKDEVAGRKRK